MTTFTGFMAWHAVVPMERLLTRLRRQNFTFWAGPRAHLVTYPPRRGELLNFAGTVMRDVPGGNFPTMPSIRDWERAVGKLP